MINLRYVALGYDPPAVEYGPRPPVFIPMSDTSPDRMRWGLSKNKWRVSRQSGVDVMDMR